MSWDALLVADEATEFKLGENMVGVALQIVAEFNYTHNTNVMLAAALDDAGDPNAWATPWYSKLSGLSGAAGAALLHKLIGQLEADPEKYRAMEPSNGWGDYDSLLDVLRSMRSCVPERPATWLCHG